MAAAVCTAVLCAAALCTAARFAAILGALGCVACTTPEAGVRAPAATEPASLTPVGARTLPATQADAGAPAPTELPPGSVRYELAGQSLVLTLADGVAIRTALLAEIEQSKVEHRQLLLAGTRDAAVEIENGHLRIGGWWLQGQGDHLDLMQRMGPHPVALFYGAKVGREGSAWRVSGFGPGYIRWKR